jgi:hypothetical protein
MQFPKKRNLPVLRCALLLAFGALTSSASATSVVFSDNFDDGDVSDWSIQTNAIGETQVAVQRDSFVSPDFSLQVYLDAPPAGSNLFATATKTFLAPVSAEYSLDLYARSTFCDVCLISYEIFVDGIRITRTSAPSEFESRIFALPALAAGVHTLGLGVHTDTAFFGRFNASFDNVKISTAAPIPEPEIYFQLISGLCIIGFIARRGCKQKSHPDFSIIGSNPINKKTGMDIQFSIT